MTYFNNANTVSKEKQRALWMVFFKLNIGIVKEF